MSKNNNDYLFYSVISFIIYIIVIGIIYLMDNYIGFLLNLIFMSMIGVILLISIISEKIERSKISPLYFYLMSSLLLASIGLAVILKSAVWLPSHIIISWWIRISSNIFTVSILLFPFLLSSFVFFVVIVRH